MSTNSDLNSTQNVSNTSSPQSADSTQTGASNSDSFQKSADSSELNQNKPVSVTSTGQPLAKGTSAASTGATILFVVVASVALLLLASSVFRFIMNRPEPEPKEAANAKPKETTEKSAAKTSAKAPAKKGSKKKSRSARHK